MNEQLDNLLSAYGELQKVNADLTRQLEEKDAEIVELREGLKRLETVNMEISAPYEDAAYCPACGMEYEFRLPSHQQHKPDCWLDKLIGEGK